MAQPLKYVLTYIYHIVIDATGLAKALDLIGGSWDLTNHNVLLQFQEFPGTACLNIREAVYNSSLFVISRSGGSSTASSSLCWGRGITLACSI